VTALPDGSPRLLPFGDGGLLVELGDSVEVRLARRARWLARLVEGLRADGAPLGVPVAGAASVLVPFDPLACTPERAAELVLPLVDAVPDQPGRDEGARELTLPVRYGGPDGPDLEAVAAEAERTAAEVIELHAGTAYEVLFIGFAPGFAYLGEVPAPIAVPRLATPRTRVPAGSVGIAGRLTGAYPAASAGGWRIVGRTDTRLFDPEAGEPALLRPGDVVRFAPR
jgi:KipI family sensor histidine kinase inhibitor